MFIVIFESNTLNCSGAHQPSSCGHSISFHGLIAGGCSYTQIVMRHRQWSGLIIMRMLIFLFLLFNGQAIYSQTFQKPVPNRFVIDLFKQHSQSDITSIVKQFYQLIDSNFTAQEAYLLKLLFVDLDSDGQGEIILTTGEGQYHCTISVLQKQSDHWAIIFFQDYDQRSLPTLSVLDTPTLNKIVDIDLEFGFGTGVLFHGHHFFRLIGSQFIRVLDLTTDAYLNGWGALSHNLSATYRFDPAYDDRVWCYFNYSCNAENVELLHLEKSFYFTWSSQHMRYEPQFPKTPCLLNAPQLDFIQSFGSDSLFVETFRCSLNDSLKTATPQKVAIIRKILAGKDGSR